MIKKHIEKARCHRISESLGTKPLFHVIANQFKAAEAWVLKKFFRVFVTTSSSHFCCVNVVVISEFTSLKGAIHD